MTISALPQHLVTRTITLHRPMDQYQIQRYFDLALTELEDTPFLDSEGNSISRRGLPRGVMLRSPDICEHDRIAYRLWYQSCRQDVSFRITGADCSMIHRDEPQHRLHIVCIDGLCLLGDYMSDENMARRGIIRRRMRHYARHFELLRQQAGQEETPSPLRPQLRLVQSDTTGEMTDEDLRATG